MNHPTDLRCQSQRDTGKCVCIDGLSLHHKQRADQFGVCRIILADWIAAGVCQACGVKLARGWCLDHDHATGRARGVLCRRCNIAAGYMEDPHYVSAILTYLAGGPKVATVTVDDLSTITAKRRRRGTGSIYLHASGLWAGKASVSVNGKRHVKVVYARSREEAASKLIVARRELALAVVPSPRESDFRERQAG